MNLPKEAWPLVGAVSAAVVAGAVSFVVSVLSKEQKTSEFRQAWIDNLREDLANFASGVVVIHDMIQHRMSRGEDLKSIESAVVTTAVADFKNIEIARLRILFRLNPLEHATLIERMNAIYNHTADEEFGNPGTAKRLISEFTGEAQRVLKSEWKRVKRGEPTFRATKWASILLVITAILVGAIYVYEYVPNWNVP
jgi:hypothetical protein